MKMGLGKVRGFLITSILPLILLVSPAVAEPDYKKDYCSYGVVIKGNFKNDDTEAVLSFKITQVIKGPSGMQDVKIHIGECYFFPGDINVKEFVIAGSERNGEIVCSLARPKDRLTPKEAEVLNQISSKGCN